MTGPGENTGEDHDMFGVRPYAMTSGRTQPSTPLDLLSLVRASGKGMITSNQLGFEHAKALALCQTPTSVAEMAGRLRRPVTVTKVVLSDLIELGVVIAKLTPTEYSNDPAVLEAVIDGLRKYV